ncbi:conserved hypothetical protein [Ralstonia solanacearum K60]|nr:conserved hypothetical protein [Ralstonia solanacearum K60]
MVAGSTMHELLSQRLFSEQVKHLTPRLAQSRGWVLHQVSYPILDCEFQAEGRAPLRLRFNCQNWNTQPPSIDLLDSTGAYLHQLPGVLPTVFNTSAHPTTGRPFICMRGSLEYHTHTSHLSDHWESLRTSGDYTLGGILTQLWYAWQNGQR